MFNHLVQGCSQSSIAGLSGLHVTKAADKKKKSNSQIWRRRRRRALGVGHQLPPPHPQGGSVRGHAVLVMNKLSKHAENIKPPPAKKIPLLMHTQGIPAVGVSLKIFI